MAHGIFGSFGGYRLLGVKTIINYNLTQRYNMQILRNMHISVLYSYIFIVEYIYTYLLLTRLYKPIPTTTVL